MPSRDEMDVDWDNDQVYLSRALPSPTNTPYRTPSASRSRPSIPRRDSSPGPSRSSSPFSLAQVDVDRRDMLNVSNDPMSLLDPRRFTPTLHASLVSEILSLRRDLEGKAKEIDNLEINLDHAKLESEEIQDTLSKTAKENRSLKRQLQLLEGGSLSAVNELAKERDEALDTVTDVRKRLEQSQKKLRSEEEQTLKIQTQWEDERAKWEDERRSLERKVHVVEGRLKIVLNEVMAAQEAKSAQESASANDASTVNETPKRSASVLSRRRASISNSPQDMDFHSNRYSLMSMQNGQPKQLGRSLADELAFDEEDEYDFADDEYYDRPDSRATISRDRPVSTHSMTMGMKARKILGLSFDELDRSNTPDTLHIPENDDAKTISGVPRPEYRDMGSQYTPPASPVLAAQQKSTADASTMADRALEPTTQKCITVDMGTNTDAVDMVTSSSQTVDAEEAVKEEPSTEAGAVMTTSISTQTEDVAPPEKRPATPPAQLQVPMIAIHPPETSPPTPRTSVVLPPHTKSISCQTDSELTPRMKTASVQTEEIHVDTRPPKPKLGASLLPSAIQDCPSGSETELPYPSPIQSYFPPPPKSAKRRQRLPPVVEPKEQGRKDKGKQPDTIDAYPGNNDNGPLADGKRSELRRPLRSSSLFAGFEESSDEEKPSGRKATTATTIEEMFSDDEIMNRPMASYTLRSGRLVSKPAPATILDDPAAADDDDPSPKSGEAKGSSLQRSAARAKSTAKRPKLKEADIRRAAMISSSTAAHARPRSPSAPSVGSSGSSYQPQPPFPVPIRFSSRKVGASASEGAQSPTPPYGRTYSSQEEMNDREYLRKVRSDVVGRSKHARRQPSDYSTPTVSTSSAAPDSPQPPYPPPMPFDDITAPLKSRSGRQPRRDRDREREREREREPKHRREESVPTNSQQTSVVDAIAQTMVGEWMWKYVRRRRSFGVPDNSREQWEAKNTEEVSASISGNGSRHKRWVWIAPYERAVMWSSKQPTSGHALLGKMGRKLVIQSVLDVKDDNPLPKGAAPSNYFGRSILILTPQRALKFTALTVDRHYVWLTALSFLSHSNMNINELAALPPAPQEEYNQRQPAPALRRNPIRDSIRVAKGKNRWNKPFTAQQPSVPEVPAIEDADPHNNINDDDSDDAADPPTIPRFSSHARKRSNTTPRPSAFNNAFRSFSNHVAGVGNSNSNSNAAAPSNHSTTTTAGSSDLYSPTTSTPIVTPGGARSRSGQSSFSRRTSEANGRGPVAGRSLAQAQVRPNFFDAVGTVRMEAFVDVDASRYRHGHGRGSGAQRTRHNGRRRQDVFYGGGFGSGGGGGGWPQSPETDFPISEDGSEGMGMGMGMGMRFGEDPFRGF